MDDIETILENIRINSVMLNKIHKKRYLKLQQSLKFFRIPIIIFSSINSIVSVSQQFLPQQAITATNSLLSLITGVISSIEMFLKIDSQMESEQVSQKEYYILATTIYKTLSLNQINRPDDMKAFLEECYSTYIKLLENSCVFHKRIEDQLTTIPKLQSGIKDLSDRRPEGFSVSSSIISQSTLCDGRLEAFSSDDEEKVKLVKNSENE